MAEPKPRKFDFAKILQNEGFTKPTVNVAATLQQRGFSEPTVAAGAAVINGAIEVQALHGKTLQELEATVKPKDRSLSTIADRKSGDAGRNVLFSVFDDITINDEEVGVIGDNGLYIVDFDPLDGTKSFSEGLPYFTVGMAVRRRDTSAPIAAAIAHPIEKTLLMAEKGKGTHLFRLEKDLSVADQGIRTHVSPIKTLEGGIVYMDALGTTKTLEPEIALLRELIHLAGGDLHRRSTGSSLDHESKLATGKSGFIMVHAVGGRWDLAGELPIIEAGGEFLDGQTLEPITGETKIAIGGVPEIVENVKRRVQEIYRDYEGY